MKLKTYQPRVRKIQAAQFNDDEHSYDLLHHINHHIVQYGNREALATWTNGILHIPPMIGAYDEGINVVKKEWVCLLLDGAVVVHSSRRFHELYQAHDRAALYLEAEGGE